MGKSWRPLQEMVQKLHESQKESQGDTISKNPRKRKGHPERDLVHLPLVAWMRKIDGLVENGFHPANERKASVQQGAMFKALLVTPGVADLIFLWPNKKYPGFILELKAPGKKPTPIQREWLYRMERNGYCVKWTDNIETAKEMIMDYFRDDLIWSEDFKKWKLKPK